VRHHQPARDDAGLGTGDRHADLQRRGLAGHPDRPDLRRLGALAGGTDRYRDRVGLPIATYFAAPRCAGSWTRSTAPGSGPSAAS
jgi:hypothetical protein